MRTTEYVPFGRSCCFPSCFGWARTLEAHEPPDCYRRQKTRAEVGTTESPLCRSNPCQWLYTVLNLRQTDPLKIFWQVPRLESSVRWRFTCSPSEVTNTSAVLLVNGLYLFSFLLFCSARHTTAPQSHNDQEQTDLDLAGTAALQRPFVGLRSVRPMFLGQHQREQLDVQHRLDRPFFCPERR